MRVRVMEGSLRVCASLMNTDVSNAENGMVVASGDSSSPTGG